MNDRRSALRAAVAFYLVWTAATWFFEGRIDTLLRPDAAADRMVYVLVVNLLLGIGGGIALLRRWQRQRAVETAGCGFVPGVRTVAGVVAGFVLGLAAYLAQGAPSSDPVVIANAFAQVFVVSAAEIVVCWSVVGAAARAALRSRRAAVATFVAALVASVLFGVYHFAHSAPFNSVPMVVLLSIVGLATSAFFFISRDVAGTVVFHNFLGTFGVVQALSAAGALAPLQTPQWPLIGTAVLTAIVLGAGYAVLAAANGAAVRASPRQL